VVFHSLSTEELTSIVDIQIGQDGDTVRVDVDGSAAGGTGALTVTRA
jgi:hypothetical protein